MRFININIPAFYSKGTSDTQRLFNALQICTILTIFGITWGDFLITY